MTIQPYQPHFLPDIYRICLLTGDSGKDASGLYADPNLLGHFYAAPYPLFEPSLTFLLLNQEGACGYVVATSDSQAFEHWMTTQWLPPLKAQYPLPAQSDESRDARMVRIIHRGYKAPLYSQRYPAHLHIDVLPIAQGQGWGRRLLDRLLDALHDQGVPGIHLSVGGRNQKGRAFYEHMGFELLEEWPGGVAYDYGMLL
jgi:ribosomal protein S18 acetylase RimI-like enzyme